MRVIGCYITRVQGKARTRGLVSLLDWTTVTAPMMASAMPTISLVRNRSPRIRGAKIQFAINAFYLYQDYRTSGGKKGTYDCAQRRDDTGRSETIAQKVSSFANGDQDHT